MRKKRVPSTPEELEGSAAEFFASVREESDRGCVLVAAAFLDEALESVLRSHMSRDTKVVRDVVDRLFGPEGPLGTFSAKINPCRALQIIAQGDHDDLMRIRIRTPRNRFAHSHGAAGFADQQVKDTTAALSVFAEIKWVDRDDDAVDPACKRFVFGAAWVAGSLHHQMRKMTVG